MLRAVLTRRIGQRQREASITARGLPVRQSLAINAAKPIEFFLSPEGRLTDRLIDWLDYEAVDQSQSLRGWAAQGAIDNARKLLTESNLRGETNIDDVALAGQFLIEGVAGHSKLTDARKDFDLDAHRRWAKRYCTMVIDAFDVGIAGGE